MPSAPAPELPGLRYLTSGKVRDLYEVDAGTLLMVASDRMSAFDVVLAEPIPGKGEVLTALTVFWLDQLKDVVDNHLLGWRAGELPEGARHLAGRALLVRRLEMLPVECVARGYLVGSGWSEYRASGTVCGIRLPAGLRQAERLAEPLFTPTTKATTGHDEPMTAEEVAATVGPDRAERLRDLTLEIYTRAARHAAERGILLADTKLEFGLAGDTIVLADEVLTPDSSRFWPADAWQPGTVPPSFDKQYLRDWLKTQNWSGDGPQPPLPADVIEGTAARYRDAYHRITGHDLDDFLTQARG